MLCKKTLAFRDGNPNLCSQFSDQHSLPIGVKKPHQKIKYDNVSASRFLSRRAMQLYIFFKLKVETAIKV